VQRCMTHANMRHHRLTQGFKSRIEPSDPSYRRFAFTVDPPKRCDISTRAPLWTLSFRAFST
jgi:hypothetical protein